MPTIILFILFKRYWPDTHAHTHTRARTHTAKRLLHLVCNDGCSKACDIY